MSDRLNPVKFSLFHLVSSMEKLLFLALIFCTTAIQLFCLWSQNVSNYSVYLAGPVIHHGVGNTRCEKIAKLCPVVIILNACFWFFPNNFDKRNLLHFNVCLKFFNFYKVNLFHRMYSYVFFSFSASRWLAVHGCLCFFFLGKWNSHISSSSLHNLQHKHYVLYLLFIN